MCWHAHSLLQKQISRKRAVKKIYIKKQRQPKNGGAAIMETEN